MDELIKRLYGGDSGLILSRDVRARRLDDGWLVHFRADAPANLAFSLSDSAFSELVRFGSPRSIDDGSGARANALRPLFDAGILLGLRFAFEAGQIAEIQPEELMRLRQAVPVDIVNLLELESMLLYLLARENGLSGPICELGSYMGGSVIPLALGAAASRNDNVVVAVDDHEWHRHAAGKVAPSHVSRMPSTLPHFNRNISAAGVADRVRAMVSDTAVAAATVRPDVSMLLVDAAHDERSLRADIAAWLPKLARGAVVAFHDYRNSAWPDVERVVDELRPRFASFSAYQTLAIARMA